MFTRDNKLHNRSKTLTCKGTLWDSFPTSPKSILLRHELPAARTLVDSLATEGDNSAQRFERTSCCNNLCVSVITLLNWLKLFSLLSHGRQIKCGRLLSRVNSPPKIASVLRNIALFESRNKFLLCCGFATQLQSLQREVIVAPDCFWYSFFGVPLLAIAANSPSEMIEWTVCWNLI